jgi:hypothetical protein
MVGLLKKNFKFVQVNFDMRANFMNIFIEYILIINSKIAK